METYFNITLNSHYISTGNWTSKLLEVICPSKHANNITFMCIVVKLNNWCGILSLGDPRDLQITETSLKAFFLTE